MKVVKNGKVFEVTEKAYRVFYKGLGFKPYEEKKRFKPVNSIRIKKAS